MYDELRKKNKPSNIKINLVFAEACGIKKLIDIKQV